MPKQLNLFLHNLEKEPAKGNRQAQAKRRERSKSVGAKAWAKLNRRVHGGGVYGGGACGSAETKGRRKEFRPLSTKQPIHLILKSDKATGRLSMLTARNQIFIRNLIFAKAKKFGVKVSSFVNVGNHLHLNIRPRSRSAFQSFLRAITNLISRFVTGARRGKPFGRFWQGLAYTRVLTSRLEELQLSGYIEANRLEAVKSKSARTEWLSWWNRQIRSLRMRSG